MKKWPLIMVLLCWFSSAIAHPMPGTTVELRVKEHWINGQARIPLMELGNAVGDERLKNLNDPFFGAYFLQHIQASTNGRRWQTIFDGIHTVQGNDPVVGAFSEAVVDFRMMPAQPQDLRDFSFNYDAVIHQVVTHRALVSVKEDWSNGLHDDGKALQIGEVKWDIPSGRLQPLMIHLQAGGRWKGLLSMIGMGMEHIAEGADHLLFILALLLPCMLLPLGKKWGAYGGFRYSSMRLLKIVTAFTIGHSITLLLGALNLVRLPSQPIEVFIAFSILVSAVHAIRPLFAGRESWIAAGFGLIHGLAFASVLSNLNLGAGQMALSILGFNMGIELMQLIVIVLVVPWFMLLSRTSYYGWVRNLSAAFAGMAAVIWMVERVSH